MLVLVILDTVLLVIAVVYIMALLRSHADILRRLTILEAGGPGARPQATGAAPPVAGNATTAAPIAGTSLDGDSRTLSFGEGSPVTLLAFLSSGCASCGPLWAGLREPGGGASLADRVVVVTHDAARESIARVRRLAPVGVDVVLSSAAWEQYAVPASPHFILTDGQGGIGGRGSALSWSALETMVDEARDDADDHPGGPARSTGQRAAHAAQTLARAGIGPGHPSLFPGAVGQTAAEER